LGRLSKTAHFGRKQNCSLRQKRRLAFWTSRIEASERSAAKLGLIKHQLGSVKGSWTVPRGLKRETHPPDLISAAAARGMSKPTPIVLFLVGIGLGLFGLCIHTLAPCAQLLTLKRSSAASASESPANSFEKYSPAGSLTKDETRRMAASIPLK
jgi:hypothetical protein